VADYGIVATLMDIAKLGMSAALRSVRSGDSEISASEAGDVPKALGQLRAPSSAHSTSCQSMLLASPGKVGQLGIDAGDSKKNVGVCDPPLAKPPPAPASQADGPSSGTLATQLLGSWHGTLSTALGGTGQTLRFLDDGRSLEVVLPDKVLMGRYWLDCTKRPCHLDIQVFPEGGILKPPVPCIVEVDGDELHLCGPVGTELQRPKKFKGPSQCVMQRVDEVPPLSRTHPVGALQNSLSSSREPEEERFSSESSGTVMARKTRQKPCEVEHSSRRTPSTRAEPQQEQPVEEGADASAPGADSAAAAQEPRTGCSGALDWILGQGGADSAAAAAGRGRSALTITFEVTPLQVGVLAAASVLPLLHRRR